MEAERGRGIGGESYDDSTKLVYLWAVADDTSNGQQVSYAPELSVGRPSIGPGGRACSRAAFNPG